MKRYANVKVREPQYLMEMMIKKGLTQRSLAAKSKVSYVKMNALINGGSCGPTVAKKICNALECEFDDIFFIDSVNNSNQYLAEQAATIEKLSA